MKLLWTWLGEFLAYREEGCLFSYTGRHIGRFFDKEVYSDEGMYLGELMNDRLSNVKRKAKAP